MMELYFRIKDNGATVFRLTEDETRRRLDLTPIAEANVRSGAVRPRPGAELTGEENARIAEWMAARAETLARRETEDMARGLEAIHAAAAWYAGKPDEAAAEALSEEFLIALHDLRAAIVRFKARA